MADRRFDNVVREVLAEAARSLLAEHDRLLEERGRSNEECGDTLWSSRHFADDTEDGDSGGAQDQGEPCEPLRDEGREEGEEEKAPDVGSPLGHELPVEIEVATKDLEERIRALSDGKDTSTGADLSEEVREVESLAVKETGSNRVKVIGSDSVSGVESRQSSDRGRCSVVSFSDSHYWEHHDDEDDESGESGADGVRVEHSGDVKNRQSLCLSRGMTVQEVIQLGGIRLKLEEDKTFWHRMRHSQAFRNSLGETFIATVVVVNIAMIGISCDVGVGWVGWTILDAVFAFIFTTECIMKLWMSGWREFFGGRDFFWNIFEAMLAAFALFELGLTLMQASTDTRLSMLRVVRLARLARVIRICRLEAFSDLMMMINGAVGGAKTLLWSIVLISLPLYAVSLLLRETLGASHLEWLQEQASSEEGGPAAAPVNGSSAATSAAFASSDALLSALLAASGAEGAATSAVEDARAAQVAAEAFSSLPWALFNVFRCIVGQDCSSKDGKPIFVHVAKAYGWGYGVIYCVTMLLMTFGLFNVIVAIYVENTVAAAKSNSIVMKQHRLKDSQLAAEHLHLLMEIICDIFEDQQLKGARGISASSDSSARTAKSSVEMLEDNFEITPKFMDILKDDQRVLDILRALDINDADTRDLFDTLDVDGSGTIDVQELIQGLMKLRGDASRSDVVGVKLVCRSIQSQLTDVQESFKRLANKFEGQLEHAASSQESAAGEPD